MADSSLGVHVAVVDWGYESYFGSFERVVSWELSIEKEQSVFVGSFFGTQQQDFPEVDIGAGEYSHEGMRIVAVVLNFLSYSF